MVAQYHKSYPVDRFEQIEHSSQFNEDFIKNYDDEGDKGYFLEVDQIIQYQTILSCYKVIQKILMSNGKDKKSNINE